MCMCVCVGGGGGSVTRSCQTLCKSLVEPTRLLCLWDSPDKNTGASCHSLPQGIFPTQGSNTDLHCRRILYCWATGKAPYQAFAGIQFVRGDCWLVEVLLLPARDTRASEVTLKTMNLGTSQVCHQPFPCWNPGWSFVDIMVVISEPFVLWKLSDVAHSG